MNFPAILAAIAVIIASAQAYWTWHSRDDHIESIVEGRRLDACAEVSAAAADFGFRTEAAQASFNQETFRVVSEGPRALAKASYLAAYLLPPEASQDAAEMRDLSQRIVAALAAREEGRHRAHAAARRGEPQRPGELPSADPVVALRSASRAVTTSADD